LDFDIRVCSIFDSSISILVEDFRFCAPLYLFLQYARIIPPLGFSTKDMYKKKKVAASKHRRREKKLKERRKAQAQANEQ